VKHGVTVITNHNAPTMVLMSIDRYVQLEQAARPNLDTLTKEFDEMYARMQKPGVAERTTTALDLDSQ
jgi:PHD/YefM family antitoxin component YafN of YafNO toxin-antitoxin module